MTLNLRQPPHRSLVIILFASFALVSAVVPSAWAAGSRSAGLAPLARPGTKRHLARDGSHRRPGIPDAEGTAGNVLWKNAELGGISTPIVMRGKLYTIVRSDPGTQREGEKVVCVDAATGKKIWENKYNVFLSDVPAERVGWVVLRRRPRRRDKSMPSAPAAISSAWTAKPARPCGAAR